MTNPITTAERKIIREVANIDRMNGGTRTATQIARGALGDARWDALPAESVVDGDSRRCT